MYKEISKLSKKIKLKQGEELILIEGLPGLANVGKIVVDYLIEHFKPKKLLSMVVEENTNYVLVKPNNTIIMPKIEFHLLTHKKKKVLLITGDAQPSDENNLLFTKEVAKLMEELNCKEVVTMGGIGYQEIPNDPKIYVTGNNKELMKFFNKKGCNNKIFGQVGPIVGFTGTFGALTKIPTAILLAESFANPYYIGLRGARKILKILNSAYSLKIPMKSIEEEVNDMEEELKKLGLSLPSTKPIKEHKTEEITYIG